VSDRIKIAIPESYLGVDDNLWDELESYIFNGFLWCRTKIKNESIIFKTLNHHEMKFIRWNWPDIDSDDFQFAFVAYSVLSINGENLLPDRTQHINKLRKSFSKMPGRLLNEIVNRLSELHIRSNNLHQLVEPYAYEPRSRFKWLAIKGNDITNVLSTGIPGTSNLGMNYCQQTWCALSEIIDRREVMENDWTNAKFVGSCFAGKGVRSIDDQDKARKERESRDREESKIQIIRAYLNKDKHLQSSPEKTVRLPDGRTAEVVAHYKLESVQELAKSMEQSLNGEKDWHDLVIERERERSELRKKDMESKSMNWAMVPNELLEQSETKSSRVVGNKDTADAILSRIRASKFKNLGLIKPESDTFDGKDK